MDADKCDKCECVPIGERRVEYSYDIVKSWIQHARSYVVDVQCGMVSSDSKRALLREAVECLDLLLNAFKDSEERFGRETFMIKEKN